MITLRPRQPQEDLDAATVPVPVVAAEPSMAGLPDPQRAVSPGRAILAQMGGWSGFVYTNVPAVVFSIANAYAALRVAAGIALASAVILAVYRLTVRREKLVSAGGGVIGVVVIGAITVWTGQPRDFFLVGIWFAFGAAVVLLASLVVRRPLTGMVWSWLHGRQFAWRDDRPVLRAHDIATLFAAVVFAGRFVLNQTLYLANSTGGLAVAKVVTGVPLTAMMVFVVVWAFRRSTKRLVGTQHDPARTPAGRR